jgi:hypothetical protein
MVTLSTNWPRLLKLSDTRRLDTYHIGQRTAMPKVQGSDLLHSGIYLGNQNQEIIGLINIWIGLDSHYDGL